MAGFTRREAMMATGAAAMSAALAPAAAAPLGKARGGQDRKVVKNGRIKQSVARWCFRKIKLPDLLKACSEMGLPAIDILNPTQWAQASDAGLVTSVGIVSAGSIPDGLNEKKNHARIIKAFEENIPKAKKAGVPNVICFFGNRRGMSDEEGIANSVECLEKCKPIAEEVGVTILVENLNLVNHKDYIGAYTPYCFKIIKAVDSPRVKLLYDIYHAQMMEGNIIDTIRKNHELIGHYHTAGVPGRNEIDESQELYYPPIVKTIINTGFKGYMAHEFIPKKPDAIQSLRDAVALCDL